MEDFALLVIFVHWEQVIQSLAVLDLFNPMKVPYTFVNRVRAFNFTTLFFSVIFLVFKLISKFSFPLDFRLYLY